MGVFTSEERQQFSDAVNQHLRVSIAKDPATPGAFGSQENTSDWSLLGDLGWLALTFPQSAGGMDGGLYDALPLLFASGEGLLPGPFVETLTIAPLAAKKTSESPLADLLALVALGKEQLIHPDPLCPMTSKAAFSVKRDGAVWYVTGAGWAIGDPVQAGHALLLAQDCTGDAIWLAVRSRGATAVEQIDRRKGCRIVLSGEAINPNLTAPAGRFVDAVTDIRLCAAIGIAAQMAGSMSGLLTLTCDHLRTRRQFGVPLSSFQTLQHRAVDMMIAQRRTSALVQAAAKAHDNEAECWQDLARASKITAGHDGRFVGEQAIQLHGGIGMTEEYRAGHLFRRLLADDARFGSAVSWLDDVSHAPFDAKAVYG